MTRRTARALALLLATLGLVGWVQAPSNAVIDRDCSDFQNQSAAQTFFVNAGAGDPHRLDDDGDGRACETLPCPCGVRNTPPPANPGPAIYREAGNVVRVVDGDTLKVRLRRGGIVDVRMLGINTPERGRCGAGEATDNLRRLAPVGSTVDMVSDRTQAAKDRYGRLLRYVARRGGFKDLSYRQAWNGYTKRYVFGGKPVARDGQYVRAIANARSNSRGLWSNCW
ncbi:thermonuclease family protein [Nocardioides xinjiangensis]|uniref:thermonuclease family protein n=1 Tax=Nocardioides xinjiangensis TaxID=2817376 RepID=UPI001B316A0C|nr:thermonuclease family protein [Nocardioides sp. SYSU D00514]